MRREQTFSFACNGPTLELDRAGRGGHPVRRLKFGHFPSDRLSACHNSFYESKTAKKRLQAKRVPEAEPSAVVPKLSPVLVMEHLLHENMSGSTLHIPTLFSVAGKVALVTGGQRGIGFMISKALVSNGAKVYITSRNRSGDCDAAAAELQAMGPGTCVSLPGDLNSDDSCKELAARLAEKVNDCCANTHDSLLSFDYCVRHPNTRRVYYTFSGTTPV
jgi:hypothetical protein